VTATFEEPTPPPVLAPDIDLNKAFAASCRAGTTTTFTLSVANIGNVATGGPVIVTDHIPITMTLVLPVNAPGWDCTGSNPQLLSCSFPPPLDMGTSAPTITATVQISPDAIVLLNEATAETAGDLDTAVDQAVCRASTVPAPAMSPFGYALALLALAAVAGLGFLRMRRSGGEV
jgi:uncharacterized repeat protein (TIGR01451 family)